MRDAARTILLCLAGWLSVSSSLSAQTARNVLVVVNDASPVSRSVGDYYAQRRAIPPRNILHLHTTTAEVVPRLQYQSEIATPISNYLKKNNLVESILYIATTLGVPLKIPGGDGLMGDEASVDSELTLLYSDQGAGHILPGSLPNPFFGRTDDEFSHPRFPIYLVTRLAGYDFNDVKAMIDRSLHAVNRGKFVIDLAGGGNADGESWLSSAASQLPPDRVVLDNTATVLYSQKDVIGYASWGSNDVNRNDRFTHFQWLPGAIVTEFVSTDGRTFERPPPSWTISDWNTPRLWFAGSPQSLSADYIHEGATGASGHVYEPYLNMNPRPDLLLPAYYKGRNLAESYYLSIPRLSWQNIVIGDPLCSLGKPN
jgi:uncharacterized protein (TIGR03790 family)